MFITLGKEVDFSHLDLKLNVHVIVMLNSCIPAAGRKMF